MILATRTSMLDRVAAAPISWGVCEMPGWGYQLPVERVLAEMAAAGFTRTELGSLGYMPTEPLALRALLDEYGLSLLGGFVPLVLHDPARSRASRSAAARWADLIASAGGAYFVTCVISHPDHWRQSPLRGAQWAQVSRMLAELDDLVGAHGLTQALHPHVGSLVESHAETSRILSESGVSLVLDTAHLSLGGTDPAELAELHTERIALVHLKDVDFGIASVLESGEISFERAVQLGLFPPLGRGGLPIARVIASLEATGRDIWYVLEQDAAIKEGDAAAVTRLSRDISESLSFLRSLSLLPEATGIANSL